MNKPYLNYSTQGEGEILLIIHGLFGSSRNWQSIAKQFSTDFKVITLDLRNHGDSFQDPQMDYHVMASDVLELMNSLNIHSAHVLGHSMGGKLAMKLNQLHPERVDKLVVADIAPVSYPHSYDEIIDPVLAMDLSAISTRKQADEHLAGAITDQRIRLFLLQNLAFDQGKAHWKLNWSALKQNMRSIIGFEDIQHWQIANTSLFIRGDLSDYVTDDHWDLIRKHFPNTELVTLKKAGHWLHAEQPQAFVDAVLKFLRD